MKEGKKSQVTAIDLEGLELFLESPTVEFHRITDAAPKHLSVCITVKGLAL